MFLSIECLSHFPSFPSSLLVFADKREGKKKLFFFPYQERFGVVVRQSIWNINVYTFSVDTDNRKWEFAEKISPVNEKRAQKRSTREATSGGTRNCCAGREQRFFHLFILKAYRAGFKGIITLEEMRNAHVGEWRNSFRSFEWLIACSRFDEFPFRSRN